jgi:hypothetical protein
MRRIVGMAMLCAASILAGCASGPDVRTTVNGRHEPTRVRSLLIVVDDSVFEEASHGWEGRHFARALGSTLKDTAGSIPVTLLQIDSGDDPRALPKTIMSSQATQIMYLQATSVTTRGERVEAVWQLAISDVDASIVLDEHDAGGYMTRVVAKTFYRERIHAPVTAGLDILVGGIGKHGSEMGMAIGARLRDEHVLTPDPATASTTLGSVPAVH